MLFDNVTADGSVRVNAKVYRAIFSAHIQPNAAKLQKQLKIFSGHRNETFVSDKVSHLISN